MNTVGSVTISSQFSLPPTLKSNELYPPSSAYLHEMRKSLEGHSIVQSTYKKGAILPLFKIIGDVAPFLFQGVPKKFTVEHFLHVFT